MIENKKEYSAKVGTNLRLDRELKEFLIAEAEKRSMTLTDYVNIILADYFGSRNFKVEGE